MGLDRRALTLAKRWVLRFVSVAAEAQGSGQLRTRSERCGGGAAARAQARTFSASVLDMPAFSATAAMKSGFFTVPSALVAIIRTSVRIGSVSSEGGVDTCSVDLFRRRLSSSRVQSPLLRPPRALSAACWAEAARQRGGDARSDRAGDGWAWSGGGPKHEIPLT